LAVLEFGMMTWWPRRIATSDPLRFGVFTGKNARLTMTAPSPKAARIGRQDCREDTVNKWMLWMSPF